MKDRGLSEDSTIYHYTLVKRISLPLAAGLVYWAIPLASFLYLLSHYRQQGSEAVFAAILIVPVIHGILLRVYRQNTPITSSAKWKWRWHSVWFGFRPSGFISAASFFRIQHQLAFVGAAVLSLGFPWLPPVMYGTLLLIHVWFLLPGYVLLIRSRRLKRHVLIKLNSNDASFYTN